MSEEYPLTGQTRERVKHVVELLVKGDLQELVKQNLLHPEIMEISQLGLGGLPVLEEIIAQYPGKMTMPSDFAFDSACYCRYQDDNSKQIPKEVVFDLWFDDGKSDLSAVFFKC